MHLQAPSLQVREIRTSRVTEIAHRLNSANHVLHVAFNNLVVAGEKRFDGKAVDFKPGRSVARTLYLPPSGELTGWSIGQVDFLRLEISPLVVQAACDQAERKASTAIRPATPLEEPVIWHLACILRADLQCGNAGGLLLRDSIQNLLVQRLTLPTLKPPSAKSITHAAIAPARLRVVCDYIASHLHVEIRLSDLAAVAGLSQFHFTRAFKLVVGLSPYQYVLEQRLLLGCRLLESSSLPIRDIATATGFATLTGFTTAFRRKWGVNPSSYRRSTGSAPLQIGKSV